MRGTGDWSANERPENWRQTILYLYPNGSTPLTAIMSMVGSEKTDDINFHWSTKSLPTQGGSVAGIYTDSTLSSAYSSGAKAGTVVYVKVSESLASEFRPRHTVKLSKELDDRYDTVGRVLDRLVAGDASYVAVMLLEAPPDGFDLTGVNFIEVAGNSNPQGATIPDAMAYNPVERMNKTQIFRNSLSLTRTARLTRLRTHDAYKEAKRECLELHAIEMEKAYLWSVMSERVGANGKPETTTRGLVRAIKEYAPENVFRYHLDPDYTGDTWLTGGEEWLDTKLEQVFRYGSNEKMALVGSGALLGIQRLIKATGTYNIDVRTVSYGLRVGEWVTPFGTIYLKSAPLFSQSPSTRNDMLVFEPTMLRTRYISDTFFKSDDSERRNTNNSVDGTEEEYLTEAGLEHHHEVTAGYFAGVGLDNTLTP